MGVGGTRSYTDYGKRAAYDLTTALGRAGFGIVSGLALGIDSFAHIAALEEQIPTVAVLACGVDDASLYPPQNLKLAHRILEAGGAIISEYEPGTRAQLFTFPQRNRIISGMSKGVLVVEGDIKSGTMITAKAALDQGRDVFAVPGPMYASKSEGTNYLIQRGAQLVMRAEDILEAYGIYLPQQQEIKAANPAEAKILAALAGDPLSMDQIIRTSGLEASVATAALMVMEVNKKVRNLGNGKFVLYS